MERDPHAPWAEIDHAAIAANIADLRQRLAPGVALLAVVKADGYGHGAAAVAATALRHGAAAVGVARLAEGIVLREAGLGAPILVFGPIAPELAACAARHRLTASVADAAAGAALAAALPRGQRLHVHAKLDTGMGRLGACVQTCLGDGRDVLRQDAVAADLARLARLPELALDGIYTHLACAGSADPQPTRRQLAAFRGVLDRLDRQGVRPRLRHAANSAAILAHPASHFDLVRSGIALHGLDPGRPGRQAMTVKARIVRLQHASAGTTIGYDAGCRLGHATSVATVAIGYGDGYDRARSAGGSMLVHGRHAPILGRVCMDFTMLDVGAIPAAAVGDEVVVYGTQGPATIRIVDVARDLGRIPYELTTAITARVVRVHHGLGRQADPMENRKHMSDNMLPDAFTHVHK